jgi:hypothetical protein
MDTSALLRRTRRFLHFYSMIHLLTVFNYFW